MKIFDILPNKPKSEIHIGKDNPPFLRFDEQLRNVSIIDIDGDIIWNGSLKEFGANLRETARNWKKK